MEPTRLLADIDSGVKVPNTEVFRFNRLRTLTNTVIYAIVVVALIVVGLYLHDSVNPNAGGVFYGAISVWALLILASLWRAWSKFRDLLSADSNVLVVAPFGVILRRRNRVKTWLFEEFPETTQVVSNRTLDSIYMNRKGRTFDQMLVDDGSFGPMSNIARALDQYRPGPSRVGN